MPDDEENIASDEFSLGNYYSLLELLDKLGKEGVAELVSKGNPQRITRGDMIYFVKSDVNRILGENLLEDSDSIDIIVDDQVDTEVGDLISKLTFNQTLVRRRDVGDDEEVYRDKVIDLAGSAVIYGRSKGDPEDCKYFKECGIISSAHGKLYLDEDVNLLYENQGANKSKVRGWKDKNYAVLGKGEIGVLIAREALETVPQSAHTLMASVKIGYQTKPHFIIRISVSGKNT